MHRPSRARRIFKWTGAALSLLIVVTWVASLWYLATLVLPGNRVVGLYYGGVGFASSNGDIGRALGAQTVFLKHLWVGLGFERPRIAINSQIRPNVVISAVAIPYWLLLLLTAIPTAWLWHRDRRSQRIRPGCCLRCGYDLTGNTSGVCSECGVPATAEPEKVGR